MLPLQHLRCGGAAAGAAQRGRSLQRQRPAVGAAASGPAAVPLAAPSCLHRTLKSPHPARQSGGARQLAAASTRPRPSAAAGASAGASSGAAAPAAPAAPFPPGFDLPLAIALAATAFESYLEPQGANRELAEVTLNSTKVTYCDSDFVLEHFEGLLELTIAGADGLKAVNITGGSDPYVIATLGDSAARTEVLWGQLSPQWQETHTLYVPKQRPGDARPPLLRLRVLDKNKMMSDVDLGVAVTPLAPLLAAGGAPVRLPLTGTNAQGSITVSAKLLPFANNDALTDDVTAEGAQIPEAVPETSLQQEVSAKMEQLAAQVGLGSRAPQQQQQQKGADGSSKEQQQAAAKAAVAAATAAAAAAGKKEASERADGPPAELGDVVKEAKQKAVETLSVAVDSLQGTLRKSGMDKQADALSKGRSGIEARVSEAADAVASFVESEGLSSLPVTDLSSIITRVAASRASKQPGDDGAAAAATAAAAAAATAAAAGGGGACGLPALSPEAMPFAWKALASAAGKMVDQLYRPVAYVENAETDTQAWVYVGRELREVVVAFRGTEQVKWKDLVSDINLIPTSLDAERTGAIDLGLGKLPFVGGFKKGKDIMVHSGFLAAYDSVSTKLRAIVDVLTSDRSPDAPWTVFLTGHSLGGALATLAAYEQAGRRGPGAASIKVQMYTYGAPRVGNKAFADEFNARMAGRSWRITNSSDIVPSVPRLMGYAHVATGVRLDSSGCLLFDTAHDVLGEGREVAEVITDLASQAMEVAQGTKGMDDVFDAIAAQEMDILSALVDGSALGQHMEDFYLATLKEAVLAANPQLAGKVQLALEQATADAAPVTKPDDA